jgi:hypothetical protein
MHLRVDSDEERALVENIYIPAAREHAETYTGRCFINQTWQMFLDTFPGRGFYPTAGPLNSNFGPVWFTNFGAGVIRIPRANLQSFTSITYVDTNGNTQVWDPSQYVVEAPAGSQASPGRVWPAFGIVWPITQGQRDAVTLQWVSGYGATAASVPAGILHAILLLVGEMYEHRETASELSVTAAVLSAYNILSPYMVEA